MRPCDWKEAILHFPPILTKDALPLFFEVLFEALTMSVPVLPLTFGLATSSSAVR